MDGKLTPMEIKILEAIDNGALTNEQLKGGLIALINEEMEQNEHPVNMELLNACENLLFRIHNSEYISHKTESLCKAKGKLKRRRHRRESLVATLRVAAAVILLIGASLTVDSLIRQKNLTDYSTVDEQQHIVSGNVVEGPFINEAVADKNDALKVRDSQKWQEAVDTFGYAPEVPTWLPEGWKLQEYYASTSRYISIFRIQYAHAGYKNLIKYSESHYVDVEMAVSTFEQNSNGEQYRWNDLSVYISTNTDESIAIWMRDETCYSISGPLALDEMELVINSIQRSDK